VLNVIFEDDLLLVLSKPAGRVVNRALTTRGETTLQDELEERFGIKDPQRGIGGRAGIVHRLDKETSGILIVAKTEEAFRDLQAQFKVRQVDKEYLALVHGEAPREGRIKAPVARNPKNRMKFSVVEGGRKATTEYKLQLKYNSDGGGEVLSFLWVYPLTGRTHQIRVHLKHIDHPIVSDPLYLSKKRLKSDLAFCPRLFLHAASLGFAHPATGARMRFEAELPEDLQKVLSSLQHHT
jgi:23S rRNA pseudouridine1911/1915/1917 synthase